MSDFRDVLKDSNIYLFDGGYGTLLQQRGLPAGVSPEIYGLSNPDAISQTHKDYVDAGARVITTNTFGGSRFKLGLEAEARDLNRTMVSLARKVAGDNAFLAASIGPTGHFVQPLGELTFRELVEAYKEQITGCVEGGADLIMAETHFDLAEAKAVVIAARQVCDLPVAVSMTFEGATCLTGTAPLTFIDTMQNLGVELVATNCSAGPEQLVDVVAAMLPRLDTPLLVQPNAGLPELDENGNTVFRLGPEDFARQTAVFADMGAKFVGGCCGSTPDHIRALGAAISGKSWKRPDPDTPPQMVLTSRAASVPIGFDYPGVIIGERINPTGKDKLIADLQQGRFDEALRLAEEQIELGAPVLDVNVGASMVNEEETLPELVKTLFSRFPAPLCLDSSSAEAVRQGLWVYPGSPLVNSISGEPGRMEELGPLCKLFGAPFILLPLKGRKLPYTSAERLEIIEELLDQAYAMGIPKRLIMVDALALTVSSKPLGARYCLETIRHCREEWGLPTTLGLSNISFGLPARELLNSNFLTLCMGQGMCSFIANPSSRRLQQALASTEVLLGRDAQAQNFISKYADWKPGADSAPAVPSAAPVSGAPDSGQETASRGELFEAVLKGAKDAIVKLVEAALERGANPSELVNDMLIPAIMEVGERYERKEYFLPQLILSAETLQNAFERLKPLLEEDGGGEERPVIIMATVEGDIHDIGKNIVCLMLRNHGFEVVDLGKDVTAETIVNAAREHNAAIIGLSALMTTTMVRMEDTIKMVNEQGLDTKVIIGGAVITESFAESIGADGFSTDAVTAVKLAKDLAGVTNG